jgi:hypothetical protein
MASLDCVLREIKRGSSISGEISKGEGCLVYRNIKKDIKREEARCRVYMWRVYCA